MGSREPNLHREMCDHLAVDQEHERADQNEYLHPILQNQSPRDLDP